MIEEVRKQQRALQDAKKDFRKAAESATKRLSRERDRLMREIRKTNKRVEKSRKDMQKKAEKLAKATSDRTRKELKEQIENLKKTVGEAREEGVDAPAGLREGAGVEAGAADGQVLVDAQLGEDAPALGHQRDAVAGAPVGGDLRDLAPRQPHAPRAHGDQPGQRHQRRRLARAVGADQGEELARGHGEGEVLHRQDVAIGAAQPLDLEHQAASPPR